MEKHFGKRKKKARQRRNTILTDLSKERNPAVFRGRMLLQLFESDKTCLRRRKGRLGLVIRRLCCFDHLQDAHNVLFHQLEVALGVGRTSKGCGPILSAVHGNDRIAGWIGVHIVGEIINNSVICYPTVSSGCIVSSKLFETDHARFRRWIGRC